MMRGLAGSTALALLCSAATPVGTARAQGADTVEQVERLAGEARALYDKEEYGQAVAVYLEAYKLQPTAAVLYNVAVIYDKKLGEADLAIDFYRRYIGSPDADPAVVQRATARIQELKTAQAEAEAEATARRERERARRLEPEPTLQPIEAPKALGTQSIVGYVTLAGGLALVAGGAVMGVLAGDAADDFSASNDLGDKLDHRDTAEGRALVADVLYGVGAAAAITGLVLVVLDDGPVDTEGRTVGVAPTPGGAGVYWGGTF